MAKQIFRLIVHIVVVGTLAVMVLSLRSQLNEAKRELARRAAAPQAPAQREGGVYVLCRFDLKPDADIADYAAKTLGVVPTVRAEEGCRLYTLLKDADTDWDKPMKFGERTMFMLEKWDSVEALKAHLATPHMKAFGPTVRDMRTSSTFHVLQEVK